MKSNELRPLSLQELQERLEQTTKNLYQLRVHAVLKELQDTSKIRAERRTVARLKHVIAEKQRAAAEQAGGKA